jgi:hypothetical protein
VRLRLQRCLAEEAHYKNINCAGKSRARMWSQYRILGTRTRRREDRDNNDDGSKRQGQVRPCEVNSQGEASQPTETTAGDPCRPSVHYHLIYPAVSSLFSACTNLSEPNFDNALCGSLPSPPFLHSQAFFAGLRTPSSANRPRFFTLPHVFFTAARALETRSEVSLRDPSRLGHTH